MKYFLLQGFLIFALMAQNAPVDKPPISITAIDIALEPDAIMIQRAKAANARLLKDFREGFVLGKTHQPHISILQRYVRTDDLDKVYAEVGKLLANVNLASWKLKAYKYYYIPWMVFGLAGIVIEPTDEMLELQQNLIDAVTPFTVPTATAAAFVTTRKSPHINEATIRYVEMFIPNETGENYNPHVTIGIATEWYLKKMLAEPFDPFTFSLVGMSVYQLGNDGTARKKLKEWKAKPMSR